MCELFLPYLHPNSCCSCQRPSSDVGVVTGKYSEARSGNIKYQRRESLPKAKCERRIIIKASVRG